MNFLKTLRESKYFVPSIIGAATATSLLMYILNRRSKQQQQNNNTVKISELYVFPVKSLGGMKVQEWPICETGFLFDRQWMVVAEEDGKFVTQRQIPTMCLVHASVNFEGKLKLTLSTTGETFEISTLRERSVNDFREVEIWDNAKFKAIDCGNEAAAFLSKFLGKQVRLVEVPKDHPRELKQEYKEKVLQLESATGEERKVKTSFVDGHPFLLTSEASLADLQQKLPSVHIHMVRFRPNIVVKGGSMTAYAEDTWKSVEVVSSSNSADKKLKLYTTKHCTRCTVPCVDPETGKRQLEIKKLLDQERLFVGEHPIFGINMASELKQNVSLKVGDVIQVSTYQVPPSKKTVPGEAQMP